MCIRDSGLISPRAELCRWFSAPAALGWDDRERRGNKPPVNYSLSPLNILLTFQLKNVFQTHNFLRSSAFRISALLVWRSNICYAFELVNILEDYISQIPWSNMPCTSSSSWSKLEEKSRLGTLRNPSWELWEIQFGNFEKSKLKTLWNTRCKCKSSHSKLNCLRLSRYQPVANINSVLQQKKKGGRVSKISPFLRLVTIRGGICTVQSLSLYQRESRLQEYQECPRYL